LDLYTPSVVNCTDVETGETLNSFRAGPGSRWEEVAATSLWVAVCNQAKVAQLKTSVFVH
jgi:hypothetical protein